MEEKSKNMTLYIFIVRAKSTGKRNIPFNYLCDFYLLSGRIELILRCTGEMNKNNMQMGKVKMKIS